MILSGCWVTYSLRQRTVALLVITFESVINQCGDLLIAIGSAGFYCSVVT